MTSLNIVKFKYFTSFTAGSQVNSINLRDNYFLNNIKTLRSLQLSTNILSIFFHQVEKQTHINFIAKMVESKYVPN